MQVQKIGALGSSPDPHWKEWFCGTLVALAAGALLGVLAALPYDRLLGLSGETGTVLRSLVTTAVLSGLHASRVQDLILDAASLPEDG
jgi:hypothetical protein